MMANGVVGVFVVAAATLCVGGLRVGAADPKAGGGAEKEVAGLAKEIVRMKIVRQFDERAERSPAEKTVKDEAKVAQVLALFPEAGTKKEPDDEGGRGYSVAYSITLYREKGTPSTSGSATTGNSGPGPGGPTPPPATGA